MLHGIFLQNLIILWSCYYPTIQFLHNFWRWSWNSRHQFPWFVFLFLAPQFLKKPGSIIPPTAFQTNKFVRWKFIPKPSLTQLEFRLVKGTLWRWRRNPTAIDPGSLCDQLRARDFWFLNNFSKIHFQLFFSQFPRQKKITPGFCFFQMHPIFFLNRLFLHTSESNQQVNTLGPMGSPHTARHISGSFPVSLDGSNGFQVM